MARQICDNMKAERARRGITQDEMAKALGMTYSTYSRKENCKSEFTVSEVLKASEYFKINVSKLMEVQDER